MPSRWTRVKTSQPSTSVHQAALLSRSVTLTLRWWEPVISGISVLPVVRPSHDEGAHANTGATAPALIDFEVDHNLRDTGRATADAARPVARVLSSGLSSLHRSLSPPRAGCAVLTRSETLVWWSRHSVRLWLAGEPNSPPSMPAWWLPWMARDAQWHLSVRPASANLALLERWRERRKPARPRWSWAVRHPRVHTSPIGRSPRPWPRRCGGSPSSTTRAWPHGFRHWPASFHTQAPRLRPTSSPPQYAVKPCSNSSPVSPIPMGWSWCWRTCTGPTPTPCWSSSTWSTTSPASGSFA